MRQYPLNDLRPGFAESRAGRFVRGLMNAGAPRVIRYGSAMAVCLPLAAAVFIAVTDTELSHASHAAATAVLMAYGILSAIYYVLYRPRELDAGSISARAGSVATFWAGYIAIYAVVIALMLSSEASSTFWPSGMDIRYLLVWSFVPFAPVLVGLTQALVPEAFWPVSARWQDRMLSNAAFMLFLHVSLTIIATMILLLNSFVGFL